MTAPITLRLSCRACSRSVVVRVDVGPRSTACDEAKWTCPACHTLHRTGVIGEVIEVEGSAVPDDQSPAT